jgi:hypothetical protein
MSCKNPTHGRRTVPVDLPVRHAAILHDELNGWIAGIEEDLAGPRALPDREALTREAEAFGRLLAALDDGEIALPDEEARAALARAAEGYAQAADYGRSTAVHDAHHALLVVLAGTTPGSGCAR